MRRSRLTVKELAPTTAQFCVWPRPQVLPEAFTEEAAGPGDGPWVRGSLGPLVDPAASTQDVRAETSFTEPHAGISSVVVEPDASPGAWAQPGGVRKAGRETGNLGAQGISAATK